MAKAFIGVCSRGGLTAEIAEYTEKNGNGLLPFQVAASVVKYAFQLCRISIAAVVCFNAQRSVVTRSHDNRLESAIKRKVGKEAREGSWRRKPRKEK